MCPRADSLHCRSRNGDIDGLARLGIGGQLGRQHHRGRVLQLRIDVGRQRHAKLLKHGADALRRERRLSRLIAGTIKTDNQSITNQLIGSHALNRGQILDSLGLNIREGADRQNDAEDGCAQGTGAIPQQARSPRKH